MHGPQNKKASLDKWYKVYEQEFEDRRDVESTFATVLGELERALPSIRDTRWKKKSDFYSLFLVLATYRDQLPFSAEARKKFAQFFVAFSHMVNEALSGEGQPTRPVKAYAKAVQRAASDLANRRTRAAVLDVILQKIL